jgi:HlyD family secretion protein
MSYRGCTPFLLLLIACSGNGGEEIGPTAKVERGTIERRIVATGTIEPEKEIEVRPRVSGIVETVHVKAGDRVKAGQPLVEVEKELSEVRLKEASARLAEAHAEFRFAASALKRAERLHKGATMDDQ